LKENYKYEDDFKYLDFRNQKGYTSSESESNTPKVHSFRKIKVADEDSQTDIFNTTGANIVDNVEDTN
jgi:hypothetical protein